MAKAAAEQEIQIATLDEHAHVLQHIDERLRIWRRRKRTARVVIRIQAGIIDGVEFADLLEAHRDPELRKPPP
jgi:hypothetical protein